VQNFVAWDFGFTDVDDSESPISGFQSSYYDGYNTNVAPSKRFHASVQGSGGSRATAALELTT
jgi:hypothetical protein